MKKDDTTNSEFSRGHFTHKTNALPLLQRLPALLEDSFAAKAFIIVTGEAVGAIGLQAQNFGLTNFLIDRSFPGS